MQIAILKTPDIFSYGDVSSVLLPILSGDYLKS